jgi:hypothetical protein
MDMAHPRHAGVLERPCLGTSHDAWRVGAVVYELRRRRHLAVRRVVLGVEMGSRALATSQVRTGGSRAAPGR